MDVPPRAESTEIKRVEDLLAKAGMKHGARATRKGVQGLRRDKKSYKKWPRVGRIKRVGGLKLMQAPALNASGPDWLRHAFSTRSGGASGVYADAPEAEPCDLNLSWTPEDDPLLVAENRARFLAAVLNPNPGRRGKAARTAPATAAARLITIRQIHSGLVHVLVGKDAASASIDTANARGHSTPDGRAVVKGDGMMTDVPGIVLGIQTADCIPVLIADTKHRAVAAFHAGWRGTLGRIVERGVGRMRLQYGSSPEDLIAAIGPGIGPCCYSIGDEVKQEFESQFLYADELFSEVYDRDPIREKYPMLFLTQRAPGHSDIGPQTHLDLWEANLRQLLNAGIPRENITVTGECTACNPSRYFSHRAQHGFTGRMLNVVAVV